MMKQPLKYWISIVIVSLMLTGCNQMPVRNPFAGRQEPKLGELPPLSATKTKQSVNVAWTNNTLAKQQRFTKLVPLVTAQTIFAADHTGRIVALDSHSGKKIWNSSTSKKFTAGPSLMDKTLLLATSDAKVVAIDAQNGHQLWETKVSSEVLAAPSGDKGIVLVHAIDGSVIALNGKTGEKLWEVEQSTPSLTLHYSSAPVIVDNLALVGFSSGKLLALNLHTGMIEWERTISLPKGRSELQRMVDISADPIVSGDTVFVITYQGKLAAVNIPSGNLIWERDISSYQNMALNENHLFVTDNAHDLWAIDKHTGTTIWKQGNLATRYITGPAVVNGMVAVGDRGGYIHFLSAQKGHILDRFHLSGKIYQGPLVLGKELVVNTYGGKVALIHLAQQGSV